MAYIPTTPPAVLPAQPGASGLPAWIGPTTSTQIGLGVLGGVAGAVTAGILGARAGLSGATQQANIVGALAPGLAFSLPGVGLLGGLGALVKLAIGETLPEYKRREAIENPPAIRPFTGLQQLFDENPEFGRRLAQASRRRRAEIEAQLVGVDTRTGAGVSRGTVLVEQDPGRVSQVRRAEALQRVAFSGIPSIFSRREIM